MKTITHQDLVFNGLNQLKNLEEFIYTFNSYGKQEFITEIKSMGFKQVSSDVIGRDFEISEYRFRKLSQAEIDANNLELQIKQLESKFKIKISYKKI